MSSDVLRRVKCWSAAEPFRQTAFESFLKERLEALIEPMPEECFEAQRSAERIQEHFKVQDFDAVGLTDLPCTVRCLGGLLDYLEQTQKAEPFQSESAAGVPSGSVHGA